MQSTTARVGLLAAIVAAAVVLFIVLNNDDSSDTNGVTTTSTQEAGGGAPGPAAPTVITVKDGAPVGGVKEVEVDKGARVNLEVRLDQPEEEVHVHGYEIEKSAQTSPVRFSFPANLDGIFEIEVHEEGGGDLEIAELRVNP